MKSFSKELYGEYPDMFIPNLSHPLENSLQNFIIRRKDIADKMVQICIDNGLTIQESIDLLYFFANPFQLRMKAFPVSCALTFLKSEK